MQISECISGVCFLFSKAAQQVQCFFCHDDSCITIIINNFSSKLI